jgi:hypothetical protein
VGRATNTSSIETAPQFEGESGHEVSSAASGRTGATMNPSA